MTQQKSFTPNASDEVAVRVYADEIMPYMNDLDQQWMYMGVLTVPEHRHDDALEWLQEDRQKGNYHREVHFTKLRNYSYAYHHNEKTQLAKRWVERVRDDDQKVFHFHLVGLNLTNLQLQAFGDRRQREYTIYNRFFRSAVVYALKYFWPDSRIKVAHVFHDDGPLDHHDLFHWHAIRRIEQQESHISFSDRQTSYLSLLNITKI